MKEEFDLRVLDSNELTETKINLTENDVLFLYRCQKNVCRRLDWVECDPQKLFLIINRFLESRYVHQQNYRQVLKTVINVYYDIRSRITNKVTDEDIVEAMTNLYEQLSGMGVERLRHRMEIYFGLEE